MVAVDTHTCDCTRFYREPNGFQLPSTSEAVEIFIYLYPEISSSPSLHALTDSSSCFLSSLELKEIDIIDRVPEGATPSQPGTDNGGSGCLIDGRWIWSSA
ncbi:hypothetical protein PGTUg99_029447 [Puccinia graminis f. sp. tritici]|uniref:Uncharacterized protein n=1 Tax=Puccinia graminis f. sp. tritici TaxID=56615 RepID=A0A5B0SL66_PUCGR|nr:hypothetical protein PGTUg99_029447 [Puccinia graminis f. sp. tritici]